MVPRKVTAPNPCPRARGPTSGRTGRPSPLAGVDGTQPGARVLGPRTRRTRGSQAGTLLRNRSPLIRVRMRLPPRRISAPSSLDCVSTGKHSLWLAPGLRQIEKTSLSLQDNLPIFYILKTAPFDTILFSYKCNLYKYNCTQNVERTHLYFQQTAKWEHFAPWDLDSPKCYGVFLH